MAATKRKERKNPILLRIEFCVHVRPFAANPPADSDYSPSG
jgi:hypothetical protein